MTTRKKTKDTRRQERKKTDTSLRQERVKADEQLTGRIEETEARTDRAVDAVREDVDEEVHRQRRDAASSGRHKAERKVADRALADERRRIDSELERERRERAETVETSLGNERAETDRHLRGERRAADDVADQALAEESADAAALDETRAALTKRDEFMDIIGHDLKQPLVAVATAADSLLADEWLAHADPHVRERMTTICEQIHHALRRLGDLQERVAVWQAPGLDD